MPTDFIKNRYKEFLAETSGTDTVIYIPFSSASRDSLTGDVNEVSAYSSTQVELPGRISYAPTKAIRAMAGIDIDFDATIRLSISDLIDRGITIKIGDAFILPNSSNKNYVVKLIETKQIVKDFIEIMVFVTRKPRGRG